ncbi:MAG TPA: CDP-alcohol phosphatidyltransferase family protein [Bacteroidia bacterium]|nr:CDP-alcohol phosphatidyltransferase family protein [Bacteroidia bacterium]
MSKRSYYIVNLITRYRIAAAPVLVVLIITHQAVLFKWLLAVSFLTDAVDGYLARKYKVTSRFGSRLDSIGDDLTIAAAIVGLFVLKPGFIRSEIILVSILLVLFILQNIFAYFRYHKQTSFHTYTAKVAAVLQGFFMLSIFFLPHPVLILFYAAAWITIIDLVEEIILISLLPKWEADVKGVYWVLKRKRKRRN